MACFLPKFILLKSNKRDKYLRYRKEDDSNHAFLQFSGGEKDENVEIQYVKFEVEKSESMEGFVHIRSCYNKKYWVRKSGGDGSKSSCIAVEANEPEEDPSKLSCTLFKAILVDADVDEFVEHDKPQKIRLIHVDQVGQLQCVAPADSDLLSLQVGSDDDVFTAYNAVSAFLLPNYVAFTNHEGKYGGLTTVSGVTCVDFKTNDIGLAGVAIQLFQFPLMQPPVIWCRHMWGNGMWFLISGSNIVRVLQSSTTQLLELTPIRLWGNNIALRMRTDQTRFANCGSGLGLAHILGCSARSISEDAIFEVHEPVLRREISNVVYNLDDARVYNVRSVDMFRDTRENGTSVEQTGLFSVAYTKSQTMSWSDSVSITSRITASMSASIPFVGVDLGVELSNETNNTVVFGKEETESEEVKYEQNLNLPPGTKITLLVVATRALCDVPFTCNVVDTLSNGTVIRYSKNDGLYTGANEFGFRTRILEENL